MLNLILIIISLLLACGFIKVTIGRDLDKKITIGWVIYAIFMLTIAFAIVISPFATIGLIKYSNREVITATITKMENVVDGESSEYLVFVDKGNEKEVLCNADSLYAWKWNSSDFYNELVIGKTYKLRVYGYRVPYLSWYRNIIEYEEISPEK